MRQCIAHDLDCEWAAKTTPDHWTAELRIPLEQFLDAPDAQQELRINVIRNVRAGEGETSSWCPEPLSVLGRDQGPAPLEYHAGLLRLWRDTLSRHALPAPPGYGEPGVGQAIFSVSAFMDAVEPGTPVAALDD